MTTYVHLFRKIDVTDLDRLYDLKINSQDVTHNLFLKNKAEQLEWFESLKNNEKELAFIYQKNNEDIGFYYIRDIDWISRNHSFSYYIYKQHRGKGYGLEMLNDAIEYSFNTLNMNKIHGEVLSNNPKSIHIIKKCNFNILFTKKNHCYKQGEYHDSLYFEIERK